MPPLIITQHTGLALFLPSLPWNALRPTTMAHTFMHRANSLLTFAGTVLAGMCLLATIIGEGRRLSRISG